MGDMSALDSGTLLHADLNPANVLIGDDNTAHVVDWTFASRGAAFLEMAMLIPWLLKAGHTLADAEHWASQFPAWTATAPATIDLFARTFATKWQANLITNREAWALEHATAAQRWASHRQARRV